MTRVLVVDDDATLLRALALNLGARGYQVLEAATGTAAVRAAAQTRPDVVVLDLGLPDISGLDVIDELRRYTSTPIIVLSARTGSRDKVDALDRGADDYVTKPFDMAELLARLRAATRRAVGDEPTTFTIGDVTVDLAATSALRPDRTPVHLTPTEWRMLETLLRRPGSLVSTAALLTALRGSSGYTDPSYLRIYMAALRRKLEREPSRPQHLLTEPGMGYRFQP